jgi:hypothetical protein
MYIDPFIGGVLTTIFAEFALLFVWSILNNKKR